MTGGFSRRAQLHGVIYAHIKDEQLPVCRYIAVRVGSN
jgi:hypothetical protein